MPRHQKAARRSDPPAEPPPTPVDVVDGIPDRSANPAAWKGILAAAIFLAWVAFLVFCAVAAAP